MAFQSFPKQDRFRMKIEINGAVKTYYPMSIEQRDRNKEICKQKGYKILECVKLYPFSTEKNQHNFELIHNIVMCELYDIWNGEKKVSDEEYDRLEALRDASEKYFCLPLPVAWIPYKELVEAKELAERAIEHRINACIENGRIDLVQYCY